MNEWELGGWDGGGGGCGVTEEVSEGILGKRGEDGWIRGIVTTKRGESLS